MGTRRVYGLRVPTHTTPTLSRRCMGAGCPCVLRATCWAGPRNYRLRQFRFRHQRLGLALYGSGGLLSPIHPLPAGSISISTPAVLALVPF